MPASSLASVLISPQMSMAPLAVDVNAATLDGGGASGDGGGGGELGGGRDSKQQP